MKKTRVLFVGHAYVVGLNQAKLFAVAKTEHVKVGLLVPRSWPSRDWSLRHQLERPYSEITIYPSRVFPAGWQGAYLYTLGSMLQAFREFDPDIVQIEQEAFSASAFQLAIAARIAKIPYTLFCYENIDRPLSILRRWTRGIVLRHATLAVVGSKAAGELISAWGYSGDVAIMPQMGVDPSVFTPNERLTAVEGFTIGYVGRLTQEKGIDVLIGAASKLIEQGLDIQLLICGAGPESERLMDEADRLGISLRTIWLEPVAHIDVPSVLAKISVLVLPSRTTSLWREQFGHVLIEAMSMGIPTIGSSSGAIPEVIGREDLIFAENDPGSLSQLLERMMTDSKWRDQVGKSGRQRVMDLYTNGRIAERLIEAWDLALTESVGVDAHG